MEAILLARIAVLLGGCGAASYTDARTGLINDWITYPMIAVGIALNLVELNLIFLAAGAAVFALGYAVYYAGKIGGGDVKLLTAIAFLLPLYHGQIFIAGSLFVAALLAVSFYAVFFVVRYARKGIRWRENKRSIRRAGLFAWLLAIYLLGMFSMGAMQVTTVLLLALPLGLGLLFMALEHGIRKNFFLRYVALAKLEEDEVIAAEFLNEKIKRKLKLKVKGVFGKKEVQKLKKLGVKRVPVYRGMPPFAPFILLGCIAALLQPDLISLLFL